MGGDRTHPTREPRHFASRVNAIQSVTEGGRLLKVYLVNPSDVAFGVGVITPRWLYVLAAATPAHYGNPIIVDETLEPFCPDDLQPGDVVGIGIHTANALRGFEVGRLARDRGAFVVFGGIHATTFPGHAPGRGPAAAA